MDYFESERIARGRAKVTQGNYNRCDIDVRSYLDYEQKQINRQEEIDKLYQQNLGRQGGIDQKNDSNNHALEWNQQVARKLKQSSYQNYVRQCEYQRTNEMIEYFNKELKADDAIVLEEALKKLNSQDLNTYNEAQRALIKCYIKKFKTKIDSIENN
jgi:hypothetical protein